MPSQPEKTLVNVAAVRASAWFLQNSLDAYVGLQHGVLAWANETWTTITGWSSAATVGRPYDTFLFQEDVAALKADLDGLAENGRSVFTYRIASKSRGALWLRHHVVRGADGWVLLMLRDRPAERQRRVAALVRATAGVMPWRYDAENDCYEIDPDFTQPHERTEHDLRSGP